MAVSGSNPGALRAVLTAATEKALTRTAIRVQNEARRLAPVDSGTLRRSIAYSISGASPEQMVAKIGSNVEYAGHVEFGTGIYGHTGQPIRPKRAKMLRFPVKGGGIVYAKQVRGRPATPYLAPAVAAVRGSSR